MKINGLPPLFHVESAKNSGRSKGGEVRGGQTDSVRISKSAKWAGQLHEALGDIPSVRSNEVARAKADIANGDLETDEVYDTAAEALLSEL